MICGCSSPYQDTNQEEKKDTTVSKDAEKIETEEENEYIFEEKKSNVSESQKKGIMLNVVRQYCQSMAEQDYPKLASLFADSVSLYLGRKTISKEEVAQMVKATHRNKKNIRYQADYGKMIIEGYTLYIPIKYAWENFDAHVQAKIVFDEAFNITEFSESPIAQAKIDPIKLWEGKYELEGGRQIEAYLEIKELKGDKFTFSLEINPEGNCKGKFEGEALLLNGQEATSTETKACKVKFSLQNKQISVEEMPNCSLHGATCGFAGVYTKVER
ncbi:MAG: hypothetical protein Fur0027_01730 [Raineya sp.]